MKQTDQRYTEAVQKVVDLMDQGWTQASIAESGDTGLKPTQIAGIVFRERKRRGLVGTRKKHKQVTTSTSKSGEAAATQERRLKPSAGYLSSSARREKGYPDGNLHGKQLSHLPAAKTKEDAELYQFLYQRLYS